MAIKQDIESALLDVEASNQDVQESKSKMDALLVYANGVTGKVDSNIGDAIKTLCDGYGVGGSRIATGEYYVTSMEDLTTLTIQHNLGTQNVLAFWIANDGATINTYSQFYGCFLPKEAIVRNTWFTNGGVTAYNLSSMFAKSQAIGWTGFASNLTNLNLYSTNVRTAIYDDDGFVNDGNRLVIKANNRNLQRNVKYRWYVFSLD